MVESAPVKTAKGRAVPINEVLTEALRITKIEELTGFYARLVPRLGETYKSPAMTGNVSRERG
jgi:hypothetical protein